MNSWRYSMSFLNIVIHYGKNNSNPGINRQQVLHKMFPDQDNNTCYMERLRLHPTFQFPHHARSRLPKHLCRFLVKTRPVPKEEVQLKLRDNIRTSHIEVKLQSTDVADEEQHSFLPDDEEESEQDIFAWTSHSNQRALDETEKIVSQSNRFDKNTTQLHCQYVRSN